MTNNLDSNPISVVKCSHPQHIAFLMSIRYSPHPKPPSTLSSEPVEACPELVEGGRRVEGGFEKYANESGNRYKAAQSGRGELKNSWPCSLLGVNGVTVESLIKP